MKTDDVMLKWMQRIWIFVFLPLFALVNIFAFLRQGMEGGLALLWASPLIKLAAWPVGSFVAMIADDFIWKPGTSLFIGFLTSMIEPVVGAVQWFFFIPWFFSRWSPQARKRFWIAWFVSVPIAAVMWFLWWYYN